MEIGVMRIAVNSERGPGYWQGFESQGDSRRTTRRYSRDRSIHLTFKKNVDHEKESPEQVAMQCDQM